MYAALTDHLVRAPYADVSGKVAKQAPWQFWANNGVTAQNHQGTLRRAADRFPEPFGSFLDRMRERR